MRTIANIRKDFIRLGADVRLRMGKVSVSANELRVFVNDYDRIDNEYRKLAKQDKTCENCKIPYGDCGIFWGASNNASVQSDNFNCKFWESK